MFTSRAEHRLYLREDNADLRLTAKGREIGLVSEAAYSEFLARQSKLEELLELTEQLAVGPFHLPADFLDAKDNSGTKLDAILRKPRVFANDLVPYVGAFQNIDRSILRRVEIEVKYAGYIEREKKAIRSTEQLDRVRIPDDFRFENVMSLSREVIEKLARHKPGSLGQASRISGITPAAIQILHVHLASARA
jgi:tRNA uridine 5-carboxymethylaminomethyl modification enzyme